MTRTTNTPLQRAMSASSNSSAPPVFLRQDSNRELNNLRNIVTLLLLQIKDHQDRATREDRQRPHLIHEQDNTAAFTARWNGAHGKGQTPDRVILLPGQTLLRTRA